MNGDQAKTGTSGQQTKSLGSIIVLHPGHPLVGRPLPVVRRYREQGLRLWVIELPDGSRQYVPTSWCTPLVRPAESPPMSGEPPRRASSCGPRASPLSVTGLRQLAGLVRRLREQEALPESEGDDGGAVEQGGAAEPHERSGDGAHAARRGRHPTTRLGQLPAVDAAAGSRADRPDGVPPDAGPAHRSAGRGEGVTPC